MSPPVDSVGMSEARDVYHAGATNESAAAATATATRLRRTTFLHFTTTTR